MHAFTSALIAAALATLSSAAPAGPLTATFTASALATLPTGLLSVPLPIGAIPVGGVEPATLVQSKVSDVHARAPTLSIAAIFSNLQTEIQPYTEQLTYITPSNSSINEITNVVSLIKAPMTAAVPQLEALTGQENDVIMAPANPGTGDDELDVSQIAIIIGGVADVVLGAAGVVLSVTNANGGGNVTDVNGVLVDLGLTVTTLVGAAVPLVPGLPSSLAPVMAPAHPVVSELDSSDLSSAYFGIGGEIAA